MLLEGFPEIGDLGGEIVTVLGRALQIGQQLPRLAIVACASTASFFVSLCFFRTGKRCCSSSLARNSSSFLSSRNSLSRDFTAVTERVDELGEELVRLGRTRLDQLSDSGHECLLEFERTGRPLAVQQIASGTMARSGRASMRARRAGTGLSMFGEHV